MPSVETADPGSTLVTCVTFFMLSGKVDYFPRWTTADTKVMTMTRCVTCGLKLS
jgi:hypothetical protein